MRRDTRITLLLALLPTGFALGCPADSRPTPQRGSDAALCASLKRDFIDASRAALACTSDDDCQTFEARCVSGPRDCYIGANVTTTTLDAALNAHLDAGCAPEACECAPSPPVTLCEAGVCVLDDPCAVREIGELWPASDGCNTCTCTAEGLQCTEEVCVDPCEGLALPDCPPPCRLDAQPGFACEAQDRVCGGPGGLECRCEGGQWACDRRPPPFEGCDEVCRPAEGRSCEALRGDYEARLAEARACETNTDCQALPGPCTLGLGQCYEAVNATLERGDLASLGREHFEAGCGQETCACGRPPAVICEAGQCAPGQPCEGRALGERWGAPDGCNTCVCTPQGVVCTEERCDDPCAVIPPCPPAPGCEQACEDARRACAAIESSYALQVEAASRCERDSDCQALPGPCASGLGQCYEAVNDELDATALDELGAAFFVAGCEGASCQGCGPPPVVACQQGQCAALAPCGDRAPGESWIQEDGCTRCTCSSEGVVCSDAACQSVCEEIEDTYAGLVEGARACTQDADCQVLDGHCGVGECLVYANRTLTQEALDALAERYREGSCVEKACHCLLPYDVACAGGQCKPVFR